MASRSKRRKLNGVRKRRRRIEDIEDPAIKRLRAMPGKMAEIAAELGIARQATSLWKRVPPYRVLDVERIAGIRRHEIRPDLYPPPKKRG